MIFASLPSIRGWGGGHMFVNPLELLFVQYSEHQ
jgi:hypothetical protein